VKDGTQVPESGVTPSPPLQFFEQQPSEVVQASPSVLQPLPPGSGAHWLAVHTPVQHCAPEVQASWSSLQTVSAQAPSTQESEQHSPDEVQPAAPTLQKVALVQVLLLHTFEQQSSRTEHWAPAVPHEVAGEAHTPRPLDVSHRPEQQSCAVAQPAVSAAHWFVAFVQIPFAQAFVQQSALVVQKAPPPLQVDASTHWSPAQARFSPAQQSPGSAQAWPLVEHAGTWQVRGLPAVGQTRPAQQSPSTRHQAVSIPQATWAVHVPFVQLSPELQQGFVAPHVSPVPPQIAGARHVGEPSRSGSVQESAPLQHGSVPLHAVPVAAQAAGAVQTFAVQLSAPLQQETVAQDAFVPAHEAGAVQTFEPDGQPSAPLQQGTDAQEAPRPAQVAGAVHTFVVTRSSGSGSAQLSLPLQQSAAVAQDEPVPAHEGAVQTFAVHASAPLQQERVAHDVPVPAQIGSDVGPSLLALHAASASATTTAASESV
jgi:hypothetical protein